VAAEDAGSLLAGRLGAGPLDRLRPGDAAALECGEKILLQ